MDKPNPERKTMVFHSLGDFVDIVKAQTVLRKDDVTPEEVKEVKEGKHGRN